MKQKNRGWRTAICVRNEVYPNMSSLEMDDFIYSDIFDKK